VATTAGIMLSQVDSPQAAHASSNITAMSMAGTNAGAVSRQVQTAAQAAPVTPTQSPPPQSSSPQSQSSPPAQPPAPASKVLDYQFQLQPNYYLLRAGGHPDRPVRERPHSQPG
jgi:hypothetical protein